MAKHVLSLEVPDTLNKCVLRIVDTSVYNPDVAPVCPQLYVTLPGFNRSVMLDESFFSTGFSLNLTACDLEIQNEECGAEYNDLPDGIYIIKYAVSPHEYVYVEYNHLRITNALHKYKAALCDLDLMACEPTAKVMDKLKDLHKIKMYLEAAKAKVEYCHESEMGMDLYNYALKQLNKYSCSTCK
jgi:hypothetical protein